MLEVGVSLFMIIYVGYDYLGRFVVSFILHCESKNKTPYLCHKLRKILCKVLSLLVIDSTQNLIQYDHCISHHTLKTSLHYPVKP